MEKQLKLKNKIFKILPKAAAAVTMTFQNPPFSPGRDHRSRPENATRWQRHHGNKGFSGPIVSMIPDEARVRKPNGDRNGIDYQEPTSPKISCMGQIKNKKKQNKKANASLSTSRDIEVKNKHVSMFQRILLHGVKPKPAGRKSSASAPDQDNKDAVADKAPRVSQMKRFASGRDTFANFDWKAHQQVAPEEIDDCYSDEDRVDSDAEEEEDEDVKIPFSAPILVCRGGVGDGVVLNLKPRKEINLWKRRTMAPPRPLQLAIH